MDQLIEAAERRITQGEQRTALDRAILDRASTHAHRNTETLHGAQGVLVRFAVLERWAHEAAENNKKIRNYAATLLVAVLVKIAWDVLTKLGAN